MATFKVTDMPALTTEAQGQLTGLENRYHTILSGHCHSYRLFDPDGALEKIRTFSTVFFDFYYAFYSQFPAHSEHWRIASETKALERTLVWIDNFTALSSWLDDSILRTIKLTIINHAKAVLKLQRIEPIADSPRVPALVDTANEIPLLKMARASMLIPDTVASRRKAFVHPLLDAKGWSVTQWAEKAKVSRHTANNYLEAKRKTYHSSMKYLAEALGVSFQDFPK
jgi:lambda repressor-like predicted transcriptional regulator